ncbi:hypothetical protein E5288_WYG008047 [Bos mutus]|uniref:Uncharacterized protein n=1 Tax=Bos mutus TaxID=72004 RepID=A0A6B0S1V0_9CETA|nr:hypothetical protein [Bos mutus]
MGRGGTAVVNGSSFRDQLSALDEACYALVTHKAPPAGQCVLKSVLPLAANLGHTAFKLDSFESAANILKENGRREAEKIVIEVTETLRQEYSFLDN